MAKNQGLDKMFEKCDEVSLILKSLSHPVRLKVLCQLMDQEKTVNELSDFCGVSQSGMSQFLIRMRAEGILSVRKESTYMYYGLSNANLKKLIRALREIYCK